MTRSVTPAAPAAQTLEFEVPVAGLARQARKVQHSLTLQGAALIAAAQYVGHNAPAIIADLGLQASVWPELAADLNQLLMALGLLMVGVGRLRLGDLH